ncbi:DUF2746 domain-containing protein [Streptomyces smyrnaeus]|uniref:DUF2746 domain-containing protein n=1 Tax=Streptomyces smyrnaeus TaxID=1387713 RepID=UPI0033BE762F
MLTLAVAEGVQVALITAGGTVVVGLIGIVAEFMRRQSNALTEVRENTAEARDQVSNTHTTNLRDDMDRMHEDVREVLSVLSQHGTEIREIRSEIRQERRERLSVSERLDDHVANSLLH